MGKRISKKVVTLLIAFIISIILSAVISNCLHLIFTKRPELIIELNPSKIISNIINNYQNRQMFLVIILAFMLLACTSIFKVFKLNDYHAKTYKVTDNIEIPLPVGKNQNQHGSAWWLQSKNFKENFGINVIDPLNPTIAALLNKENNDKVEPIFKKGGITVGKKDKTKYKFELKKTRFKIRYFKISKRKVEEVYYVADNLHSLTIGATRSGKTRSIVLETISNTALAGESMIISDPKRRAF